MGNDAFANFSVSSDAQLSDRPWAARIIAQIHQTDPTFVPSGYAAPASYRFTYTMLGFSIAEQLAVAKRLLSRAQAPFVGWH